MFLDVESSSDQEEMTGRYYDASSPEEMNKLTESDIRHESDDAERQVQEEEEEEFEEQYFDAYSHEELIRQKTILSIRIVGQKLKNGECKESSADIWIPPNERIGSKSENHEDSHISKVSVNVDRYINNFDTFLAEETNSEKGTEPSVEQQSEDSENSSVAVGIFSDQRMEESIDTEMSESQSKMHNPECPCFEDQETLLGKRTPFYNNLTESQDDTDNSENSSSVEEEEEKYFDSNLLKEYEKQPIYRQVSKQPAEVEPVIGGRKPTGNKLNNCGRDKGLVPTKVNERYRRNAANCRVFVNIEECISPMSESKQILSTIAIQVAGYDNSLDLVNIFGKPFHKYEWYLGLIRTKVDAKYLRNVANCRLFVRIEEYILLDSESEQILQKVGEKNVITERIYRVKTYKEGVGNNNRCIGTNSGTSPNYPDDTNDARKIQNIENQRTDIEGGITDDKEDKKIERFGTNVDKKIEKFEELLKIGNQKTDEVSEMPDEILKIGNQKTDEVSEIQDEKKDKELKESEEDVHDHKRRGSAKSKKEIPVEKNWSQRNDNWLFYDIELSKAIVSVFFLVLHCPLANGNGNAELEYKADFGIFQHTLGNVSHCPNVSEHMKMASDKCAIVCGSYFPTENCAYHCMRDSSKTNLVEFCAKPKILFDFCPVYDLLGKRIQKDFDALCKKSKSFQRHYSSSDIFFCDPENCLQLQDAGGSTDLTGLLTKTTESYSGDINYTFSSVYWYILWLFSLAVIAVLVIVCIFQMRKKISAWFGKITTEKYPNSSEDISENGAFITSALKRDTIVQL